MSLLKFVDDDQEYLRWIAEHPDGYVVNTNRQPRPAYLVLHLANCGAISGRPTNGSSWTGRYLKMCAPQIAPLTDWATELGGNLRRCGRCKP